MLRYRKNPAKRSGVIEVDGRQYKAKYLGAGHYSRVYKVGDRVVYYTRGDCGKEVLSMFVRRRIPHIPELVMHENITTPSVTWHVYSAPYYRNVTKKDKSAWLDMKNILREFGIWWTEERDIQYATSGKVRSNLYVMRKFIDYLKNDYELSQLPQMLRIRKSIVRALDIIVEVAGNCSGTMGLDLQPSNFGVNEYGTLIFRDPIYVSD